MHAVKEIQYYKSYADVCGVKNFFEFETKLQYFSFYDPFY